ncbi:hypothetical protein CYG68_20730 [Morganella morganii]|uniref:Uncharacterized protein n=1 Tax=Morganella morganii TaxID=582 RepID=A0A8I0Q0H8_MORMO|nr:hypothetical protein [Morganella morganii]
MDMRMTAIDEKAIPAVINLKEEFCRSGNIHARNYSGRRLLRTAIHLPSLSSAVGGYCSLTKTPSCSFSPCQPLLSIAWMRNVDFEMKFKIIVIN